MISLSGGCGWRVPDGSGQTRVLKSMLGSRHIHIHRYKHYLPLEKDSGIFYQQYGCISLQCSHLDCLENSMVCVCEFIWLDISSLAAHLRVSLSYHVGRIQNGLMI